MSVSAADYEKLGQFYLGKEYDLDSQKVTNELVLYDSKDLVTHGVVLGMTDSGKTNPFFPRLRSGHRLVLEPSPQKQFLSNTARQTTPPEGTQAR